MNRLNYILLCIVIFGNFFCTYFTENTFDSSLLVIEQPNMISSLSNLKEELKPKDKKNNNPGTLFQRCDNSVKNLLDKIFNENVFGWLFKNLWYKKN